MVYLLAGCLLVLTAIIVALLLALHKGSLRAHEVIEKQCRGLHEFITMVMVRQDTQLRLFGDRMLSIQEAAANQIQQERITQEVVAGANARPISRPEPDRPEVANFAPDRIGGD